MREERRGEVCEGRRGVCEAREERRGVGGKERCGREGEVWEGRRGVGGKERCVRQERRGV